MQCTGFNALDAAVTQAAQMAFEAASSALRSPVFSSIKVRAILTSPDMNALKATEIVQYTLMKGLQFLRTLDGELVSVLDLLPASSIRFLSMMSPMCSRLMANAMISMHGGHPVRRGSRA